MLGLKLFAVVFLCQQISGGFSEHPEKSHVRSNKLSEVNDVESAVKSAISAHRPENDVTFAKEIKSSKDAAKSPKKENIVYGRFDDNEPGDMEDFDFDTAYDEVDSDVDDASANDASAYEDLKDGKRNSKDSKHYMKKLKQHAKDVEMVLKNLEDAFPGVSSKNYKFKAEKKTERKRGTHFHSE